MVQSLGTVLLSGCLLAALAISSNCQSPSSPPLIDVNAGGIGMSRAKRVWGAVFKHGLAKCKLLIDWCDHTIMMFVAGAPCNSTLTAALALLPPTMHDRRCVVGAIHNAGTGGVEC